MNNIQYFFSPSTKIIYCHEAHGENMPSDKIAITQELWDLQKQNPTYIFHVMNNELQVVDPNSLLTPEEINNKIITQKTYELLVLINEYKQYSIPAINRQLSSEEQQLLDDYIDNLFSLLNNLTIDTVIPEKLELSIKNILG